MSQLTEYELSLLPTEEDIKLYEKKGWYASPKIISDDLIEEARKGAERFYKGERDFQLSNNSGIANDSVDESSALLNNEFVSLQMKELNALAFYPLVGAIAAKLARTNAIRFFADSLINKMPSKPTSKGIVGWHSDKAYWPTCSSNNMLTAWIPLQDVTIDMGSLMHIDESHEWRNEQELKQFYSFNNQDLSKFEEFLKENKPEHKRSTMLLKKGQVSFHNCNTIHSSSTNVSQINRMALAIHMQDANNHYVKAYKDSGDLIEIGYDKLCGKDNLGNPNYSDENIFPTMWKG